MLQVRLKTHTLWDELVTSPNQSSSWCPTSSSSAPSWCLCQLQMQPVLLPEDSALMGIIVDIFRVHTSKRLHEQISHKETYSLVKTSASSKPKRTRYIFLWSFAACYTAIGQNHWHKICISMTKIQTLEAHEPRRNPGEVFHGQCRPQHAIHNGNRKWIK